MQYVIFMYDGSSKPALGAGPVAASDAAYLRRAAAHLKTLSDEQYMTGLACILQTAARFSYVLDGDELYWCIEWQPGLLVVRLSGDTEMKWVALRSPIPDFGGREPLLEDGNPDDYDEDKDNPQYNVIYRPWDAQFDKEHRERGRFVPANDDVKRRFENAVARVNAFECAVQSNSEGNGKSWLDTCKQNLDRWCGQGIRLEPTD